MSSPQTCSKPSLNAGWNSTTGGFKVRGKDIFIPLICKWEVWEKSREFVWGDSIDSRHHNRGRNPGGACSHKRCRICWGHYRSHRYALPPINSLQFLLELFLFSSFLLGSRDWVSMKRKFNLFGMYWRVFMVQCRILKEEHAVNCSIIAVLNWNELTSTNCVVKLFWHQEVCSLQGQMYPCSCESDPYYILDSPILLFLFLFWCSSSLWMGISAHILFQTVSVRVWASDDCFYKSFIQDWWALGRDFSQSWACILADKFSIWCRHVAIFCGGRTFISRSQFEHSLRLWQNRVFSQRNGKQDNRVDWEQNSQHVFHLLALCNVGGM